MTFYGVINVVVEFGMVSEDIKEEVIDNIAEFLDIENVENTEASFKEENDFSWMFIDNLKSVLEKLKADNKIEEAKIHIWDLEEPNETICI